MPSIRIDEVTIEFMPGESVIAAAARHHIEIPHYCWHEELSVAANCRMCLVELDSVEKLVPACQTACRDGMVVRLKSGRVAAAQRAMHELLLRNHPIDCPICDQAGECKLQDYYMRWAPTKSRLRDLKARKPRLERFGPHVLYNAERCIMCTRCVRFMEEVAKEPVLGIMSRGEDAIIGLSSDRPLDSAYSLNTVDVCPVGALTSIPFRFRQRVWNLQKSPSVCGGCARGCNIFVEHRAGLVYRFSPRHNAAVNKVWLCDEGRLTYKRANHRRLHQGLIKAQGEVAPVPSREAYTRAIELLRPFVAKKRGVAAAISLYATTEEAYVFGRFARELMGCTKVALLEHSEGQGDDLLRLADKNPNRAGVSRVLFDLGLTTIEAPRFSAELAAGDFAALVAVGCEGDNLSLLATAAAGLDVFIHIAPSTGPLSEVAHVTLPSLAWVEVDGIWINGSDRAQRLWPTYPAPAEARPSHEWLLELAYELGVKLGQASPQSIRTQIEATLPAFASSRLSAVGPEGHELLAFTAR